MDMPHEYMSERTLVTASGLRILSPVMGQVPLLASVAASTELLSQLISSEDSWGQY
jgi:hypothetical protein